jgi:hypothetical protein
MPAASSQGIDVTRTCDLPLMYSHALYIPHANAQSHHQKKLHISLNLGFYQSWKHSQEVLDDISKNMRHLWVLVFLLVTPRGECLRDSGKVTWGSCIWSLNSVWFSVLRFSVPGASTGVRNRPGDTLRNLVPYLCCLWILHQQWLLVELDPPAPR